MFWTLENRARANAGRRQRPKNQPNESASQKTLKKRLRRYFRLSDLDNDSYLSFPELKIYYKRLRPTTVFARRSLPRRLWMLAFRAYDKD